MKTIKERMEQISSKSENGTDIVKTHLKLAMGNNYSPFNPEDKNPSFSIFLSATGIRYKDYGEPDVSGDLLDLYSKMKGLELMDALRELEMIYDCEEFDLGGSEAEEIIITLSHQGGLQMSANHWLFPNDFEESPPFFMFEKQKKWSQKAADYWKSMGHKDSKLLKKYGVLSLESYLIYDKENKTFSQVGGADFSPIFAYPLTRCYFKLYRPLSKKFKHGHYGVNNAEGQLMFGYEQLPADDKCEKLIITSCPKDVISLALLGMHAVCFNSETISTISEDNLKRLESKVRDKSDLCVLFDIDSTGKEMTELLCQKYGFTPIYDFVPEGLYLPDGKKVKDVSDYLVHETAINNSQKPN